MATDSALRSVTNTLSGTTADTVTITQSWSAFEVTNHSASVPLYFRQDGTTAVGAADNTTVVLPGQSKVTAASTNGDGDIVISIVGSSNLYTIEGCS